MKTSALERRFDLYWRGINGPDLAAEVRFDPHRRWRFDRAHTVAKVALEIEGGTWGVGKPCPICKQRRSLGHNTGAGYESNCEKYNEAALQGWAVIRLTGEMIEVPGLERIAAFIRTRAIQFADPYQQGRAA